MPVVVMSFMTSSNCNRRLLLSKPSEMMTKWRLPAGVFCKLSTACINPSVKRVRFPGVGFARVPALRPTNAPPTFHLPGGPGGSFLNGLKPGDNGKKSLSAYIEYYRSISDVVFIDQRGASERGDVLKWKYQTEYPLDRPMTIEQEVSAFSSFSRQAVAEYTRRGFDLRGYGIKECAEDVNDLRKALGYRQIILIGQSFGSQWSVAVIGTWHFDSS